MGLKYLGAIPYDPKVEEAIGNPAKLLKTAVGKTMPANQKSSISQKVNS